MSPTVSTQGSAASIADSEDTALNTPPATSTESTTHLPVDRTLSGWIPSGGRTTMIRSTPGGDYLTILNGEVVLTPVYGGNASRWTCAEFEGFLRFRNVASGKYLCHGDDGKVRCTAGERAKSTHFTITPVAGKGFVMQALKWFWLLSVIVEERDGRKTLARRGERWADGATWAFIEVIGDGT